MGLRSALAGQIDSSCDGIGWERARERESEKERAKERPWMPGGFCSYKSPVVQYSYYSYYYYLLDPLDPDAVVGDVQVVEDVGGLVLPEDSVDLQQAPEDAGLPWTQQNTGSSLIHQLIHSVICDTPSPGMEEDDAWREDDAPPKIPPIVPFVEKQGAHSELHSNFIRTARRRIPRSSKKKRGFVKGATEKTRGGSILNAASCQFTAGSFQVFPFGFFFFFLKVRDVFFKKAAPRF